MVLQCKCNRKTPVAYLRLVISKHIALVVTCGLLTLSKGRATGPGPLT